MTQSRIREAGDAALLLELDERIDILVNARAVAIADVLRRACVPGVHDVVPTYRSVAVYYDPLATDVAALHAALERAQTAPPERARGRTVEVPVAYGGEFGPDLDEVAAFGGLSPGAAVERHAGRPYRVFMLGFVPGFAYMGPVDPQIAAPRRATPRGRVPAGSVGIAAQQTGIYPVDSPGGWQIIGRTPLQMFVPGRTPAALLAPGDEVHFRPADAADVKRDLMNAGGTSDSQAVAWEVSRTGGNEARHVAVLRPGLLTTVQDSGRRGHQAIGVTVSGALDAVSHRIANALVGNGRDAATLEATVVGPEIRFEQAATVALAGADLGATLDGTAVPLHVAVGCRAGSVLRFGVRRTGARAYVAVDGGIEIPSVLGSRATHTLSGLGGVGGRALRAGDRLPLGEPRRAPAPRHRIPPLVTAVGGVRLRVLPGPQDDFFSDEALELLQRIRFTVAPQSDRMGYRLAGGRIPAAREREMISDATFPGGVQVPASGAPILLMADRQTTGGYPQIATVISADLPLAAQLVPGDWVEFQVCARSEALAALVAREGALLALD